MSVLGFDHLKNRTAVITGGAGVIGSSIAMALAGVGVKTVILDLDEEKAKNVAQNISDTTGTASLGLKTNVLDKESLELSREAIINHFGAIDILINGAGGNSPKATTKVEKIDKGNASDLADTFFGLDSTGFDWVFDLNFKGTLLPTMVFGADMVKAGKGSILNVSSMNSYRPLTKIPAYSAAKSAINNFTQWLAVHFGQTGVRVNAIAPGFFLTNQNRFLLVDAESGEMTARGQKIIDNTPMNRYGEVEELNGTCLYLLSDLAQFVTGVVIPVDGGYSAFGGI